MDQYYEQSPRTIFAKFINLRENFSDVCEKNNSFVTLITGDNLYNLQDVSTEVDGVVGSFDSTEQLVTLQFENSQSMEIELTDLENHLNDTITGTSLTVGDWFGTVSKTGDLYSSLASITSKFSYSSRMTLTDINVLIDKSVSQFANINDSVEDLKNNLVSVSDNDGYISARSWLLTLNEWFKRGKESAEAQSPAMDASKPFTVQALYNIVVDAVLSTLSGILLAIRSVFTVVLGIVSSLISNIFKKILESTQGVTVDHNAPNGFIKGPIAFCELSFHSLPTQDYQIYYRNRGGQQAFLWQNDDFSKRRVNIYFQPSYSAETARQWLLDHEYVFQPEGVDQKKRIYYAGTIKRDLPEVTEADQELCEYDNFRMFSSICIDACMRNCWMMANYNHIAGTSGTCALLGADPGSITGITTWQMKYIHIIGIGCEMIWNVHNGLPYNNGISFNTVEQAVHDYVQACADQAANDAIFPQPGVYNFNELFDPGTPYGVIGGAPFVLVPKFAGLDTPIYTHRGWVKDPDAAYCKFDIAISALSELYLANTLPTSFMYTLDSITNNAMISLVAWTSVVTLTAAVVYLKVSKAIRIKKIERSITRTQSIENAKFDYDVNPTKENLDKYAKAVDKYNRMGRIFGWGTYDAANDWIDKADSGNSNPSIVPFVNTISQKAKANSDDLKSDTYGLQRIMTSASNTNEAITSDVYGLQKIMTSASNTNNALTTGTYSLENLYKRIGNVEEIVQHIVDLIKPAD
jgi:hypothetical protein